MKVARRERAACDARSRKLEEPEADARLCAAFDAQMLRNGIAARAIRLDPRRERLDDDKLVRDVLSRKRNLPNRRHGIVPFIMRCLR